MELHSPQGDKKATNTGVMDRSRLISICLALRLGPPSLPELAADAREQFVCSAPTQRLRYSLAYEGLCIPANVKLQEVVSDMSHAGSLAAAGRLGTGKNKKVLSSIVVTFCAAATTERAAADGGRPPEFPL